MVPTK
jgi:hypothetical protein